MSTTTTETDDQINELLGTDPRYWGPMLATTSDTTLARVLDACSNARLSRVLDDCSDVTLARALANMSDERLARALGTCSDETLARCSNTTLERFGWSDVPTLDRPYSRVLEATNDCQANFDMGGWHCKTTHCLGGWIVFLAGLAGSDLERRLGTPALATLILRKSRPGAPLPNFYATNEQAAAFIRARAAEEKV